VENNQDRDKMSKRTILATVMQKADEGTRGRLALVVRSSALAADTVITVSQQDYDHVQPGTLVTLIQVGWGPLSSWKLKQ
jgi:hypothetical protein